MALILDKLKRMFRQDSVINLPLFQAAMLLRCYDFVHSSEARTYPTQSDVDAFERATIAMNNKALKSFVQEQINLQVYPIFEAVLEHQERLLAFREKPEEAVRLLAEQLGYAPYVAESSIPGAGRGVFLRGEACPGSVLLFFPGLVHLAEFTRKKGYLDALLPDPDLMLMKRGDDTVIDGRTARQCNYNPFALGHMLNHASAASKTLKPNVLQAPYDFPGDTMFEKYRFPEPLRPFMPNKYAKAPTFFTTDRSAMMRTVVFLAARPLESESELLVDYRLAGTPKHPLPDWYPKDQ